MRIEHDILGKRELNDNAYYGIHTLRAYENFSVSGRVIHPELAKALVTVKKAAALANEAAGLLDRHRASAICTACDRLLSGELSDQFITDPLQGGAGTSANMNANEVIANLAIEILGGKKGNYTEVHPLDHVNMSQSTNDVFPTAVRIAAIRMTVPLAEELSALQAELQKKEEEFSTVLKIGRTQLQDAVPVMLGQEFGAWAQAISRDRWRIYKAEERLRQVNIGGTAVGTGVNADRKYIFLVIEKLRELTGMGLARAELMMDATQNHDALVETSGLLKTVAVNLVKISGDLRLLSSGPRGGIGEIRLPSMQAGSTIMPGKINPVIPEAVTQIAYQVMGCDLALTLAAQAGQLELNAFLPLLADNLLSMAGLLTAGVRMLREKCIRGIEADRNRCSKLAEESLVFLPVLIREIGYDRASGIVQKCRETGKPLRTVLAETGFDKNKTDEMLNPYHLTMPGGGIRKGEIR